MEREHFIEAFLLFVEELMEHSEYDNLIYEQQGCYSQYDVRLMNNIRLRIFCHQMNTFIKTFIFGLGIYYVGPVGTVGAVGR